MAQAKRPLATKVSWGIIALLAIAHWDFWLWDDPTLVFGFLPAGLAYHVFFSLAAGVAWWVTVRLAWPDDLEQWATQMMDEPRMDANERE